MATDDIVTELRRDSIPGCQCSWCVTHEIAANEIERLRKVIKELETEKNRLEKLTYG